MFKKIDEYTIGEVTEKVRHYRLSKLKETKKGIEEQLAQINHLITKARELGIKEEKDE